MVDPINAVLSWVLVVPLLSGDAASPQIIMFSYPTQPQCEHVLANFQKEFPNAACEQARNCAEVYNLRCQ